MPRPTSVASDPAADRRDEPRDRRASPAIGRHARLEVTFARRRGRTVISHAYAEPPFRVGRAFADGDGLHLILASSAPGVFGGDVLQQTFRVESGARVRLTSQAAQQAHPVPGAATARLSTTCEVEAGGELGCEWHPLIPFAGARVDQAIDVRIAGGGCFFWSDALMAGRLAGGERWQFASLAHEFRVTRDDRLEYLERYRLDPRARGVSRPWIADEATYFGTVLMSGRAIDDEPVERLHTGLAVANGLRGAVSQLGRRLVLVRLLSTSGPPFHDARARSYRVLWASSEALEVHREAARL
jgi:urease accessory protein